MKGKKEMDEEERKIKFWEITEKYANENSEYFEREEHIFKIVHIFAISNLIVCLSLIIIEMIFSLEWLMFIVLIWGIIGFTILSIDLIRDYIHNNKTKEKWKKYLEEINNLK